jgi:hypothetical protein
MNTPDHFYARGTFTLDASGRLVVLSQTPLRTYAELAEELPTMPAARSLFAIHLEGGELYARAVSPFDRAAYNDGTASFVAVVLARDERDALDLGRRLADARALLAAVRIEAYGSDYRAGYLAALLNLKAFLRLEVERWEVEGHNDHAEQIREARHGVIERVSTWAQAFMPTDTAPKGPSR